MSEQWRRCLLPPSATLQEAIRQLDQSGLQIVVVVEPGDVLCGTVTDGDIRRGLLRGITLENAVSDVMNRSPLLAPLGLSGTEMREVMRTNRIHQLPVVGDTRQVVGLHIRDELETAAERSNVLVIMAGGRGVRLLPHTENCPKPMLPVGGKPMLEHIIGRARNEGFRRFAIAIHYLGHMIEDYFGDGSGFGVDIRYIREESPLGTGGALGLMEAPDAPFVVTNGDVLTDVRYGDILTFHARHDAFATMAVQAHEWQHPFGVVKTDGVDITGFEEKPVVRSNVNAGIYALNPDVLSVLREKEPCDMPSLFERVRASGRRTIVYPLHESWLDVGRPSDLERARIVHAAD